MEIIVSENKDKKRFEVAVNDKTAFIDHIKTKDKIYLTHTEVPTSLEGNGMGTTMVEQVLQEIEKQRLDLIPLCPFVAGFIQKNPSYKNLLAPGYSV